MDDIIIFEATHHLSNRVRLADMGQKLVTQSLTLRCTGDQPGDVHKLNRGWDDLLRLDNRCQRRQPGIGHRHHANVGINRAKRIIFSLNTGLGERVKQGGLTDIRKADNTALDTHEIP